MGHRIVHRLAFLFASKISFGVGYTPLEALKGSSFQNMWCTPTVGCVTKWEQDAEWNAP